jgi:hypothetical protein
MLTEEESLRAHTHSNNNREELLASDICGCFHCCEIYSPNEIVDWIDVGNTAMCSRCHIDSVIASNSGYSITKEFLEEMYERWFEKSISIQDLRDLERAMAEEQHTPGLSLEESNKALDIQ